MKLVKMSGMVLGLLMVAMGLLWILQGLNIVRWPADSFMLGIAAWSWRGSLLAGAGALLVWLCRRN